MMLEKDIFAGFGGQGILLMGELIAQAALLEGRNVAWLPAYGPEIRGGTAYCYVTITDKKVASPIIDKPTSLIVMNRPSLEKFECTLQPGGRLFINSSIVDRKSNRDDIDAYYVPCSEIAVQLGQPKVANIAMLGAYIAVTGGVKEVSLIEALQMKLGERKAHLIDVNRQALELGAKAVEA